MQATDHDMQLYVLLRLFVNTPVLQNAWILAAVWSSSFRALERQISVEERITDE